MKEPWIYLRKRVRVLGHFEKEILVCPPILRQKLFTSADLDIDHDPSSTTAKDSFHGTSISLFQHHTSDQHGIDNG